MKTIITCLVMLGATFMVSAQNSISGKVQDNNNDPLIGVNVIIKGSSKGATTDIEGNFTISDVSDGTHTLSISYVGFKTREESITVSGNQTATVPTVTLFEGNELLKDVVITGERANKFSREQSAYVSKLPLKDLDNSQIYSTVTSDLIASQVALNFDDALKNATGVDKRWEATGRSGDGTGYYNIRGFSTQPTFMDGVPGFTFTSVDPSFIERIEVLKGPSATLFGSTSVSLGGLINVVTKKPYQGFGGSVSYTGGSFNTHRISTDVNTAISEKNNIYFRLNTSYLTQKSFQDAGFRKTFLVAPSLSYRVNNRLNFSLATEYSKTRQTNTSMVFLRRGYKMVSNNIKEFGLNRKASFTDNDIYLDNPTFNGRLIADYKISDNWTSQTVFVGSTTKSKGYYTYLLEGAVTNFIRPLPPTTDPTYPVVLARNRAFQAILQRDLITRIVVGQDNQINTYNAQQNFIGDFKLGKLRNRMVVGLDYYKKTSDNRNKSADPTTRLPVVYGFFLPNGNAADNPLTPTVQETAYPINQSVLDPIFARIPVSNLQTQSQVYAAYVSDVINITPALNVMLGLRLDHFDQKGDKAKPQDDYTKTTVSPKFGIVYQPILNELSFFANYQTGFINVDPIVSTNVSTGQTFVQTFDPIKSKQFEAGIKTYLFDGRFNVGLSYYNMIVRNKGEINPVSPRTKVVVDKIISKGIEIEINANPVDGLNIRGGYAYNDSEIKDPEYASLNGRRVTEAGPESLYNLWADYKFLEGSILKNLGLGLGIEGASKYLTMNNAITGVFTIPSYTILNSSVYYDTDKYRVGVKVNNITNKDYYKGWSTINPQLPRNILVNLTYKF